MGNYYNPPQHVEEVGRKLEFGTYEALFAQVNPGEALIGVYDRGFFWNAAEIDYREYGGFEGQVRSGMVRRVGYFALSPQYFGNMNYPPSAKPGVAEEDQNG